MPTYNGQQLSSMKSYCQEIIQELDFLKLNVFGFKTDDLIVYTDIPGTPFSTANANPDQKCFKPANLSLIKDSEYWQLEFTRLREEIESSPEGEFKLSSVNKFIHVSDFFSRWVENTKTAYFSNDVEAYHNVYRYRFGLFPEDDDSPDILEREIFSANEVREPTETLTEISEPCRYFSPRALRPVTARFKPQEFQSNMDNLRGWGEGINSLLNTPQPKPDQVIEPVQVSQTGTNKLFTLLGEIFSYIKESFGSIGSGISSLESLAFTTNLHLHDIRSAELKQARLILQDLRGESTEVTISTQELKRILNKIEFNVLTGSEGNYYPIPLSYFRERVNELGLPIDPNSSEPLNIVRLSLTNGILSSLRRADDNAQVRYYRVNDRLFEINTGISIIKPITESMQDKLDKLLAINEDVAILKADTKSIQIKLDSINERI